ncbi:MAG TPA: DUF4375 domain-containing protein [Stellaceae bacterium]|nr:DUF4375 domain-containing protein [Stellaceae bacterium]
MEKPPNDIQRFMFGWVRSIRGKDPFPGYPVREKIRRSELAANPHRAWNGYLDFMCYAIYEELTPIQRIAFLSDRYYNEVYNGGHLQYFLNDEERHAKEAIEALPALGGSDHAAVLKTALETFNSNPPLKDYSLSWAERAKIMHKFDRDLWACKPDFESLLKNYFESHFSDFIEIVEDSQT